MSTTTKNPTLAGTSLPGLKHNLQTKHSATPQPWQRVLCPHLARDDINRFRDTRIPWGWCLQSTADGLDLRDGHTNPHYEVAPDQFGVAHCNGYRLIHGSRQRVLEICGGAL